MYELWPDGVPPDRLEREMAATQQEFEHGLNLGVPGNWIATAEDHYRILQDGVQLDITILSRSERRIGALTLPLLSVAYAFSAGSPQQRRRLLTRLDRAMQRGGG
ncbi:MAG: hypothetical protein P8103_15695 [Candidatus Thiodiazotropha sp.]